MYQKKYHIHFVGIGGIGMSGIAELLLNLGYKVSGSDLKSSDITRRLKKLGGTIYQGHQEDHIAGADVVVISSAVKADNPEVLAAGRASIPVIPRAEMLAELMRLKYSIAVSGAHGKTSTTSIIASVLEQGGLDPTVVIGGRLISKGTNAVLGKGDFIVAEADESDGSFLKFTPTIAVVTNIDREHLDFYKDLDDIKNVFLDFIHRIPFYGLCVLCLDNEAIQDIIPGIRKRFTTYGMNSQADLTAREITCTGATTLFKVYYNNDMLGEITLNLPGKHNINNALSSIAVGIELGISFDVIKTALETHKGVARRLEKKGVVQGITVMDDYGHHPTEIKTTLSAVRESWPEKRIVVAFQPHRFTRTNALFSEFSRAFYQSDILLVLPIYAAGESEIEGITARTLADAIRAHGHKNVILADNVKKTAAQLKELLKKDDIFLTMGAGDVYKIGDELLTQG